MTERLARRLASGTTRRSFIASVGAAVLGVTAGRGRADGRIPGTERVEQWFGFCGHYFTTGSCKGPYRLPRVDRQGKPLRPEDGHPVDDLGRPINDAGQPIDAAGNPRVGPDGQPLPPGRRTRLCEDWTPRRYPRARDAVAQGSWYRCCDDQIRKLWDCCSATRRRINDDQSLRGYCYGNRRVFCVMYTDTGVPC